MLDPSLRPPILSSDTDTDDECTASTDQEESNQNYQYASDEYGDCAAKNLLTLNGVSSHGGDDSKCIYFEKSDDEELGNQNSSSVATIMTPRYRYDN